MPAKSEKQRRFFGLVRGVQSGDVSPDKVSSHVKKVAKDISAKDASDFAKGVANEESKKKMLDFLKELKMPQPINEEEINPIAKQFTVKDDYEKYIKRYVGQPFLPKELEALTNFKESKPSKITRTDIRFDTTDEFNNNTSAVIKKMKDSGKFSYTAFIKHTKANPDENPEQPPTDQLDQTGEREDITVAKSTLFSDEIEGASILTEFLKKIDI